MIAIKKSHQNQEAELKYEIDRLKDQLQKAKEDYAKAQEKTKRVCLTSRGKYCGIFVFNLRLFKFNNINFYLFVFLLIAPQSGSHLRAGAETL